MAAWEKDNNSVTDLKGFTSLVEKSGK